MIRSFYRITSGAKHIRAKSETLKMHSNGLTEDEAVESLRQKIANRYPNQAIRLIKEANNK